MRVKKHSAPLELPNLFNSVLQILRPYGAGFNGYYNYSQNFLAPFGSGIFIVICIGNNIAPLGA